MDVFDPTGGTWAHVRKHCEAEIALAQARLERIGADPAETQADRGRIAALRGVLRLADPKPDATPTIPY